MLQSLSKATGFDLNEFAESEILQEANKKFVGTHVVINGELENISSIYDVGIRITKRLIPRDEVKSFVPWMPKAGIYHLGIDEFVYLYRLPRRQWLKSFSYGNNYSAIFLQTPRIMHPKSIFSLENTPSGAIDESRQWLFKDNELIFKWLKVGDVDKSTWVDEIKVTQPMFYQEVFDKWHGQYKITLG